MSYFDRRGGTPFAKATRAIARDTLKSDTSSEEATARQLASGFGCPHRPEPFNKADINPANSMGVRYLDNADVADYLESAFAAGDGRLARFID